METEGEILKMVSFAPVRKGFRLRIKIEKARCYFREQEYGIERLSYKGNGSFLEKQFLEG